MNEQELLTNELLQFVGLAQMEVIPGQPVQNLQTALALVAKARDAGVQLLALPELCLSGYMIGDLWEEQSFVNDCVQAGHDLVQASQDMVLVFGNVALEPGAVGEDGRPRRYNAAWLAQNRTLVRNPWTGFDFIPKTLLPNYREFEESRHFYDLRRLALERGVNLYDLCGEHSVSIAGHAVKLGVILCEDGWGEDYGVHLVKHMASRNADLVLNLSASPYTRGKDDKRNRVFSKLASDYRTPIGYVNCIGSQNNGKTFFGFDGCSTLYNARGEIAAGAKPWCEQILTTSTTLKPSANQAAERVDTISPWASAKTELVPADVHTLVEVITRYLARARISRVVIGVSGGVDSAVSAALFTHICGPQNVLLASMPSAFNSATTKNLAHDLAQNLGCFFVEVPIGESMDLTKRQIDGLEAQSFAGQASITLSLSAFHLENVQARDRSSRILSALASAFGGVFTCNANKAEATVGYSTLYGDHGGFLAPLADLWKNEVYALGSYLNRDVFKREVIPVGIFSIKPSAELSTAQNPEQGGGDPILYAYHDRLFHAWQQAWRRSGPEEILTWYSQGILEAKLDLPRPISDWFPTAHEFIADLERWWNLFKGMGVVKRVQAPPIVALSRRAFGYDYRESIMAPYFSRNYFRIKAELLSR